MQSPPSRLTIRICDTGSSILYLRHSLETENCFVYATAATMDGEIFARGPLGAEYKYPVTVEIPKATFGMKS